MDIEPTQHIVSPTRASRGLLRSPVGCADTPPQMTWVFERNGQHLRYQIRRDIGGRGYELIVTCPDDTRVLAERFDDPYALHERTLQVEHALVRNGWQTPHLFHPPHHRPKDHPADVIERAAAGIL